MNIIERVADLDGIQAVERLKINFFMGEEKAHKFILTPPEGTAALTGSVSATFLRSDRTTWDLLGALNSGNAEVILTSECYQCAGTFTLSIYLTEGESRVCVYAATGNVISTQTDPHYDGGIVTDLTELLGEAGELQESVAALEDGQALSASAAEALAMSPEEWNQSFGNGCTINCKRNSTQITWRYSDMEATGDQYAVIAGTRGVSTYGTLNEAVADLINTQHAGFAFDETPFDMTAYDYCMDLFVDASEATSVNYIIWLATVSENGEVSSIPMIGNDHLVKHQLEGALPAQFVQAVRTNKNLAFVYQGGHRLTSSEAADEVLKFTWNFKPDRHERQISALDEKVEEYRNYIPDLPSKPSDTGAYVLLGLRPGPYGNVGFNWKKTNDWDITMRNVASNGTITLGKGTADEVTVTAAQMKQLLALLS